MKLFVALFAFVAAVSAGSVPADLRPMEVLPEALQGLQLPSMSPKPNGRIVNGQQANQNEFPYQAGLFLELADGSGTAFCGGSLISDQWVLTAAHCADGVKAVTVLLGAHKVRDATEERVEIKVSSEGLFVHPKWSAATLSNDLALIKLPYSIPLTKNISPVNLPPKTKAGADTYAGRTGTISGWGKDSDSATSIAEVLQKADVPIISNLSCRLSLFLIIINENHICTRDWSNWASTCNGDSGGPLVVKEADGSSTLVGATSFGIAFGCAIGHPAAFTRVSNYLDWINETTGIPPRY